MLSDLNILKRFSLILKMGQIESGPPLSTILGTFGINTVKFCTELNELTMLLPEFFILEVIVNVNLDKTYTFLINEPSVALLLKLVKKEKEYLENTSGGLKSKTKFGVYLEDIFFVSFFKFGNIDDNNLKSIYGTLKSLNFYVFR
jgi:ribosomal protein L11